MTGASHDETNIETSFRISSEFEIDNETAFTCGPPAVTAAPAFLWHNHEVIRLLVARSEYWLLAVNMVFDECNACAAVADPSPKDDVFSFDSAVYNCALQRNYSDEVECANRDRQESRLTLETASCVVTDHHVSDDSAYGRLANCRRGLRPGGIDDISRKRSNQ